MEIVPIAVAKAAIKSGVARNPIEDWKKYAAELSERLGSGNKWMKRLTIRAKRNKKRVVFAEADFLDIVKAAQIVYDEGIAIPILLGNKKKVKKLMEAIHFNPSKEEVLIIDPKSRKQKERREKYGILGSLFNIGASLAGLVGATFGLHKIISTPLGFLGKFLWGNKKPIAMGLAAIFSPKKTLTALWGIISSVKYLKTPLEWIGKGVWWITKGTGKILDAIVRFGKLLSPITLLNAWNHIGSDRILIRGSSPLIS
jgi:hypothetical protein